MRDITIREILDISENEIDPVDVTPQKKFRVTGNIAATRSMGKGSFIYIKDDSGIMETYISTKSCPNDYQNFIELTHGTLVTIEGSLFRTKENNICFYIMSYSL